MKNNIFGTIDIRPKMTKFLYISFFYIKSTLENLRQNLEENL